MSQKNSSSLKRTLSLRHLIFLGLAFMAPSTVYGTYGIAASQSGGMIASGYLIALFIMLFTAYSYAQLVKVYPSAGAAYSFAQKAINPHIGFLTGWAILLDYMLSPMISSLLLGISLKAYFPSIPMYIWIVLFVILLTIINILGIKFAANINTYVFLVSLTVFVLFTVFSIKFLIQGGGAGTSASILPFYDEDVETLKLLAIVPILAFTYLGFDAITALSEEVKNPVKTLPKAIFLIPIIGSTMYVVATYLLQLVVPDISSFKNPEAASYDIAYIIGGIVFKTFFVATGIVPSLTSAISSSSSASRIMYAMGRDNVLPKKIFGYVSSRSNTPIYNIFIVSAVALSSIFFSLKTATAFINFGAFLTFIIVNLSVISHFYIKNKKRSFKETIKYLFIPSVGAIFIFILSMSLGLISFIVGGIWMSMGLIYIVINTKMFKKPLSSKIAKLDVDEN